MNFKCDQLNKKKLTLNYFKVLTFNLKSKIFVKQNNFKIYDN